MVGERSLRSREKEEKLEGSSPRRLRQRREQVRYDIYYCEEQKDKENNREDDEHDEEAEEKRNNQISPDKVLWRVTCGTKKGILNKRRLRRGELCIMYNSKWISPIDFEIYGGRSSAKKWKQSIYHNNKPLEFFFKTGDLCTRGFKFKKTPLTKQDEVLVLSDEDSEAHYSADNEDEDAEKNRWDSSEETDEEDVIHDKRKAEKSGGNKIDEDLTASTENSKDQPALEGIHPSISAKIPPTSAYPIVAIERLPEGSWNVGESQVLSDEKAESDDETEVTDNSSSEEDDWFERFAVGENEERLSQRGEMHEEMSAKSTVDKGSSKDLRKSSTKLDSEVITDCSLEFLHEHDHHATTLQDATPNSVPSQSSQVSYFTQPASPRTSNTANVDEMDLDQLKREKLKKQLKVLQLQEEYYTMKLNKLKAK